MKVEYIDDNPLRGVKYDFQFLRKEYKKLKCPADVYNPCKLPFESAKWFVILSERARGKTTNLLLFGMLIYQHYGRGICYIRSNENMIAPRTSRDLFSNIVSWGYVNKITNGKYNDVIYKSRRWYFCFRNDDGEVEREDTGAFCTMLSIDKNEEYKSVLETKNDFIVFDEFIERYYYPEQFILFCDLCKTIIRERESPILCLSANSLDIHTPWFTELMIAKDVEKLGKGEQKIITTPKGTNVYVEILGKKSFRADARQTKQNTLYYGFDNPKLSSITGSNTWAFFNYPHTPVDFKIVKKNYYLEYMGNLINLEICLTYEEDSFFINCHPATKTYDDSIIFSLEDHLERNYMYQLGKGKYADFIWKKYKENRFTFSDNTTGSLVEKYYDTCKKLHR